MPKEVFLYVGLVMFLWFTISATFYVMYKGGKDRSDKDNANGCLILMCITPFMPLFLPLAVALAIAVALLVGCFWYLPDKISKVTWLNFKIEDPLITEQVQRKQNLPAPLKPPTIPYCERTDLMTLKKEENKTIKPVEPKILPKAGDKKPSFKEAFEDTEPKNTQ